MSEKLLKVGFVGYCPPVYFDATQALVFVKQAFDKIVAENPDTEIMLVSGLTNVGTLAIAYKEAKARGWKTMGIACKKAAEHPNFPVNEKIIIGESWGDESAMFLSWIDCIVRVGGGNQSKTEVASVKAAGKQVLEYELPQLVRYKYRIEHSRHDVRTEIHSEPEFMGASIEECDEKARKRLEEIMRRPDSAWEDFTLHRIDVEEVTTYLKVTDPRKKEEQA